MRTIGSVYIGLGLYKQSQPILEQALALREPQDAADDAELGLLLASLGDVYMRGGRHEEAKDALQRSLQIRENLFGPVHR